MDFNAKIDQSLNDVICLQYTRHINETDLKLPEWIYLKEQYSTVSNPVSKAITTILCSVFFKRRVFFVLTRTNLIEMVKDDRNHSYKPGMAFKNSLYPLIRAKLFELGIAKEVMKNEDAEVSVLEIVHKDLLTLLCIDSSKQQQESIEFLKAAKNKVVRPFSKKGPEKGLSNIVNKKDSKDNTISNKLGLRPLVIEILKSKETAVNKASAIKALNVPSERSKDVKDLILTLAKDEAEEILKYPLN